MKITLVAIALILFGCDALLWREHRDDSLVATIAILGVSLLLLAFFI